MRHNDSHHDLHMVSCEELNQMRRTYAWRKLSEQVRAEEPTCRLRLPGCTGVSEVADHIIPASQAPDLFLVRSNIRGSCKSCNDLRGRLPVSDFYPPIRVLGSCDEHDRGNRRFLVRIGGQLARHLDHYQHHETALMGDSADEILERIRPVCNN